MKHASEIKAIEKALRDAESEMRDLLAVVRKEYVPKPWEGGEPIGTYKIYEVRHCLTQIRAGVRDLKKSMKEHTE